MAEEAQKTEPEAAPAAAPAAAGEEPKPKSKLPMILGAVGLVVALAGGGWFFLGRGKKAAGGEHGGEHGAAAEVEEEDHGETPSKEAIGALLPLDPFVANLADEDGKRYLKANLQVEFYASKVPEEFNQRMPQVRDLLLTLFTSKLFSEIRTPAGKAVLRDEIVNRLNRAIGKDIVKAVYFTDFIVQ
jgi:flagellar FliL protein